MKFLIFIALFSLGFFIGHETIKQIHIYENQKEWDAKKKNLIRIDPMLTKKDLYAEYISFCFFCHKS